MSCKLPPQFISNQHASKKKKIKSKDSLLDIKHPGRLDRDRKRKLVTLLKHDHPLQPNWKGNILCFWWAETLSLCRRNIIICTVPSSWILFSFQVSLPFLHCWQCSFFFFFFFPRTDFSVCWWCHSFNWSVMPMRGFRCVCGCGCGATCTLSSRKEILRLGTLALVRCTGLNASDFRVTTALHCILLLSWLQSLFWNP